MPLIEKRYAEALIEVAECRNAVEVFRQDLKAITGIYEENSDFRFLLFNPYIGSDIKKDIARSIFSNSVSLDISSLFMLLLDKGRIRFLPGILREYEKLADKKINELSLRVISSAAIDQELLEKIGEKFREKYHASRAKVEFTIDTKLIGGVKVIVGDRHTDGTLRGKLDSMRKSLLKG